MKTVGLDVTSCGATEQNHSSYSFMLTKEQRVIRDNYIERFPTNITLGQRWEALRRLFVNRLGRAVHDFSKPHASVQEADRQLEHTIGESVVRGYALGMLHSMLGAEAEEPVHLENVSGSETAQTDPAAPVPDYRVCDITIELLHQMLRDALPMWNDGKSIVQDIRKQQERERLSQPPVVKPA